MKVGPMSRPIHGRTCENKPLHYDDQGRLVKAGPLCGRPAVWRSRRGRAYCFTCIGRTERFMANLRAAVAQYRSTFEAPDE